ncbi:hypothetical protein [Paramesorhizobium deserti]|uniref:hypothetical protein n=1 Tax=Paramesorhizobium deserti TaxID=1494590 RepID=UPI001FCE100D|nr:hypothetical protein [Paramesorhizobium deserti]
MQHGFLRDVIKGWLTSSGPQTQPGDTTPWRASFWEFCARYCRDRFGNDWFLSPEQSLLLHAEATAIPPQVIANSPKGANNNLQLLFGTSLYDLKVKEMPPPEDMAEKNGLRVYAADARPRESAGSLFPTDTYRGAGRAGRRARRVRYPWALA